MGLCIVSEEKGKLKIVHAIRTYMGAIFKFLSTGSTCVVVTPLFGWEKDAFSIFLH